MGNTIEQIYNIKSVGGQETYRTFDGLNKILIEMKANKQALGTFDFQIDPAKIVGVSKGFTDLINSNKDLMVEMKALTAEMSKFGQIGSQMANSIAAAMAKVNMATIPNIQGFAQFQKTLNPATVKNYEQSLMNLGSRLTELNELSTNTKQSLKILGDEYRENAISEEEYVEESEKLTTELTILKTQITDVSAAMATLNKVYNPGLLEEENAELASNKVLLQQRTQMLKLQTVAEMAAEGSINEARAQAALYRKELNDLNLTTDEGIARQKELLVTIEELDSFIKNNADMYTRQKINIGNYPTVGAELSAVRAEMAKLASAGQAEGTEFAELSAKAKELSASLRLVADSTKEAATFGDKFGSIVERMGIRFLANLLVFQVAMELISGISEAFKEMGKDLEDVMKSMDEYKKSMDEIETSSQGVIETNKALALSFLQTAADINVAYDTRMDAISKLRESYQGLFKDLSDEQLLAGGATDAEEKLTATLERRQKVEEDKQRLQKTAVSLSEARQSLDKLTNERQGLEGEVNSDNALSLISAVQANYKQKAEDMQRFNVMQLQRQFDEAKQAYLDDTKAKNEGDNPNHDGIIQADLDAKVKHAKYVLSQTKEFSEENKKAVIDLKNAEKELSEYLGKEKVKKPKGAKEPHDYTSAQLEAQKRLTDLIEKEEQERLTFEMNAQKEIFDNTQRSLQQRLSAYSVYARDMKQIIQLQSDAQIADVQSKLNKIASIEQAEANKNAGKYYDHSYFDKSGTIKPEEETLLINKDALSKQLDVIVAETKVKTQQAESAINRDISGITSSSMNKMLGDISDDVSKRIAIIEEKANAARQKVYDAGGSEAKQDKGVGKINDQEAVDKDNTNIAGNSKEQQALQAMIDEESKQAAHNTAMEQPEAEHLKKLQDLKNKAITLQTQLQTDQHKQTEDNEAENKRITETLKSQSVEAFSEIGNSYLQLLQEESAINQKHTQQQLDWTKKLMDSQAQSNQQKQANDKQYYLAQQQLEKQKLLDQRHIAEEQMGFDYAVGVMKIWAANAADPIVAGLETAGLTAVYTAKLALMSAEKFERGGVPSSGGVFGGNSHSTGGTPFFYNGGRFEAEAGELAIINKRSAGSNQNMTVSGTPKQIASAINAHGGGYDFAPGAQMYRFEYGGSLGAQITPPSFVADYYSRGSSTSGVSAGDMKTMFDALISHTSAVTQSINDRIDRIQVHVSAKAVTDTQNKTIKTAKVGNI